MPSAALIYAAGFGTRMRPLTDTLPKPLVKVASRPLIDHALDHVRAVQPKSIVANLHYKAEQLQQHLANSDVHTLVEAPQILDMGGGLRNADSVLQADTVWTINPDALWRGPNPLALARDAWRPDLMDALLVCVDPANALEHDGPGSFTMDPGGALSWGPELIYGGVQIIKMDPLRAHEPGNFRIQPIWTDMAHAGRLHGVRYPGQWCDVGHPAAIATAESMLRNV